MVCKWYVNADILEASYTLHHQVVTSQGPCLVKTTHIHFASKWDAERLCAEHIWKQTAPLVKWAQQHAHYVLGDWVRFEYLSYFSNQFSFYFSMLGLYANNYCDKLRTY